MADETTEGGTVLGFPALLVPGAVTEAAGTPTLAPLTTDYGPPASLSVPANPVISGMAENAAAMEAAPAAGPGSLGQVAAMSSVMMAGITVAALRGAYHAVSYVKARAEHFKSVRDQQEATTGKANAELEKARLGVFAAQQKGRVPSGQESGRTSKGPGPVSSQNSGRTNSMPPAGPKPAPLGKQSGDPGKKPDAGRSGAVGGRGGSGVTPGPGKVSDARRKALEDSGRSPRPDRNSGSEKGPGKGPGKQNAAPDTMRGAARQRAAERIANGPAPKTPKVPRQPAGPDTMRGAARQRAANRITNGPTPKTPKPPKTPKQRPGPDTIRGAARQRAADRITNGNWKPAGPNAVRGPDTIRGAARTRVAGRILNGKKPKGTSAQTPPTTGQATPGATAPPGPKVNLTKQPKPAAGTTGSAAGTTGTTGAGATGTAGTASGGASGSGRKRRGGRRSPYMKRVNKTKKKAGRAKAKARSRAKARMKKAGGRRHSGSKQNLWQRAATRRSSKRKNKTKGKSGTAGAGATGTSSTGTGSTGAQSAQGGFGPPPGWGHTQGPTTFVSRADKPGPHTAGAIAPGTAALPRAPYASPHVRPGTSGPDPTSPAPTAPTAGGPPVTVPAPRSPAAPSGTAPRPHGTQYADSDLTIGDVIEADADMGEEIRQGAEDALEAADACEKFVGRLEALHAKIVELKVPGVLEGLVLMLIDKTGEVKARAEAIAEAIPAAAEAIENAGHNAERRDKNVADVTRDQGHIAPAEREYHDQ
ncbi:hypothetical protein ACWCYY_35030 [Kitasatospora sp. NPDC001664]